MDGMKTLHTQLVSMARVRAKEAGNLEDSGQHDEVSHRVSAFPVLNQPVTVFIDCI